jgi:hypothetical protein
MKGIAADGKDASMNARVQRLDPAIHDFRVWLSTDITGMPFSFNIFAVPPVDSISMFMLFSFLANSTIPFLSETLNSARLTVTFFISSPIYIGE